MNDSYLFTSTTFNVYTALKFEAKNHFYGRVAAEATFCVTFLPLLPPPVAPACTHAHRVVRSSVRYRRCRGTIVYVTYTMYVT